jgi:hypothetical protein
VSAFAAGRSEARDRRQHRECARRAGVTGQVNAKRPEIPVMNAVNTLPMARKLMASTAPDDTVSVKTATHERSDCGGGVQRWLWIEYS